MMLCGHPLAARRITVVNGLLVTDCWACAVRAEVIARIVGPKRASTATVRRVK